MNDLMKRDKLLRSKLDSSYFLAQKYVRPKKGVKLNVFEKIANTWDWSTFLPGGLLKINVNERHLIQCAKILGWLHSLIFLSAVLSTVGLGFGLVLPYYIQHKHPVITSLALPFGIYLTVNIAFHIWMCFTTAAGSPSKQDVLDPELPFCSSCLLYKPDRTHHCRICNKCILKVDVFCSKELEKVKTLTWYCYFTDGSSLHMVQQLRWSRQPPLLLSPLGVPVCRLCLPLLGRTWSLLLRDPRFD